MPNDGGGLQGHLMFQRGKFVSIVAPFFNEGEAVQSFYEAICPIMDQVGDVVFEVVCVDDGSLDDTLPELIALVERDPRFRVIELSRNFGKEAALTAGIDAAKGDAVIPIDADLQDPPELIPVLIKEWLQGADVVLARRADRRSDAFLKRTTAEVFYALHNRVSSVKIPKNVGDFRLMNRASIDALKRLPERQRFMKGLFAWIGFKTAVVDYTRPDRAAGTPKFSAWKLWNLALEGTTSFSATPLKVWTYIGSAGALLTFVFGLFIVVRTLLNGVDIPGYASLLVFLGCLQLVSVGMLGEYIGRIFIESKQRPIYIVRKIHEAKKD